MRYLVMTDIHANIEALRSCLADARSHGYDRLLVLGDLVGYGADPNAVIDSVRDLQPAAIVRGNHDKTACDLERPDGFNPIAKSAVLWTSEALTPENRAWLAALPRGPHAVDDRIEICHGAPFDEDAYIFDELDALQALTSSSRPLCLFGHTHRPAIFALRGRSGSGRVFSPGGSRLAISEGTKYLVNPGAVGQPRDGDPRAAYAIADSDEGHVELFRVRYPVEEAQAKVRQAGLPETLANRLAAGR